MRDGAGDDEELVDSSEEVLRRDLLLLGMAH